MSESKHTPELKIVDEKDGRLYIMDGEQLIAMLPFVAEKVFDVPTESDVDRAKKYAQLFARAPVTKAERDELLAALKEMTAMADSLLTRVQKMDGSVKQAFKKSRAAIAKAEKSQ